jgi:hypothetical protein
LLESAALVADDGSRIVTQAPEIVAVGRNVEFGLFAVTQADVKAQNVTRRIATESMYVNVGVIETGSAAGLIVSW